MIKDELISLNYEDGNHSIVFGEVDYSKLPLGKASLNYFSNVGQGSWAVVIDHMEYNGKNISREIDGLENFVHLKIAYIDSGNSSMQIMRSDFNNLYRSIHSQDDSVVMECNNASTAERCRLYSPKKCEDLMKSNLSPLEFYIQDSRVRIKPHGYLDDIPKVEDK